MYYGLYEMLTLGEAERGVYRALYYFCNFSVSLKLLFLKVTPDL